MNTGQKRHTLWVRTGPSTKHPLFETWRAMVRRCSEPESDPMGIYYYRGIKVYLLWTKRWERGDASKGWAPGFRQWLNYMEMEVGERPPGYTMDRIDTNGNYEPWNLRWASDGQQQKNKRPFIQPNNNPTGYKWIQYRRGHYEGSFVVRSKRIWCGCGQDIDEVYAKVIKKRLEMNLPIPEQHK